MPSIRLALVVLAASAALAACGDSRRVAGEQGTGECATCHGFPPTEQVPLFAGEIQHPQNTACFACHAATVDSENAILAGGAHLNGVAGDVRITSGAACNQCHGMPPPPFLPGGTATAHPQNTDCWVCHGTSVSPNNELIAVENGGTHFNGVVDVAGGHPEGYAAPAVHGPDANAGIVSCQACHGADYSGGSSGVSCTTCHSGAGFADWRTNCTFCHGTQTQGWNAGTQLALAAPPASVDGQQTAPTDRAVGAHQKHLPGVSTLSAGFGCAECHPPVAALGDATHTGPSPAEIAFGTLATTGGAAATYVAAPTPTCSATYCHGSFVGGVSGAAPVWIETPTLTCQSCHTAPAANTKPSSVWHERHVNGYSGIPPIAAPVACVRCHVGYTEATVNTGSHVNGEAEAIVQPATGPAVRITGWDCTACHDALGVVIP